MLLIIVAVFLVFFLHGLRSLLGTYPRSLNHNPEWNTQPHGLHNSL